MKQEKKRAQALLSIFQLLFLYHVLLFEVIGLIKNYNQSCSRRISAEESVSNRKRCLDFSDLQNGVGTVADR